MIIGTKYINNAIFYTLLKKHNCPYCNERLRRIKKSKIVNSKSAEARNYDFNLGDGFMEGDVRFVWKEFQCPRCKTEFTIEDMRRIERRK